MNTQPAPEFSRPLQVADLSKNEKIRRIEADAGERSALAQRFGLVALDSLNAMLTLDTQPGRGLVRVRGEFSAEIVQNCVITLEPLSSCLHTSFERLYGPQENGTEESTIILAPDAEEPPEPFVNGAIDIGEAVAEQMAIELDPFPRAAGAIYQGQPDESDVNHEAGELRLPFAALKDLMNKTD
jgi:uncharacterized metal-binding protein YceD (DUF177 family)